MLVSFLMRIGQGSVSLEMYRKMLEPSICVSTLIKYVLLPLLVFLSRVTLVRPISEMLNGADL